MKYKQAYIVSQPNPDRMEAVRLFYREMECIKPFLEDGYKAYWRSQPVMWRGDQGFQIKARINMTQDDSVLGVPVGDVAQIDVFDMIIISNQREKTEIKDYA